ncbi:MAG: PAS domain S-box protein [bacterium]|nr:PAS domain S-box protein [bacterium]
MNRLYKKISRPTMPQTGKTTKRFKRQAASKLGLNQEFLSDMKSNSPFPSINASIKQPDKSNKIKSNTLTHETKHFLQTFLNTSSEAIITADSRGSIVFLNKGAESLLGYTQKEIAGKPLTLCIPKYLQKIHESGFKRASLGSFFTPSLKTKNIILKKKDGSELPVHLAISRWETDEGEILFTGVIKDVGQQQRMDEEIKHYIKDMEILFSTSMQLLEKMSYDDLFEFVGYKISALVPSSTVMINEYEKQKNSLTVRLVLGDKADIKKIKKVLKRDPLGLISHPRQIPTYTTEPEVYLKDGGKFFEIFDKVSESISQKLAAELNLGNIYIIPFIVGDDNDFLGSVVILLKKGQILSNQDLLEAIVNQTSSALKRKRAEEKLRESEERFRAIFEDAAIGIALADMNGRPIEVNKTFEDMIGYTKEELQKMEFVDFTHPEDVSLDTEEFREMKRGHRVSYSLEKRYVRKDGQGIWVQLTVSLIKDLLGQPEFTLGVIRDITESKKTEEALKESEQRLRLAVDNYPGRFVIYDHKRRIQYANINGFSPNTLSTEAQIGRLDEEIFPRSTVNAYLPTLKQAIKKGQTTNKICKLNKEETTIAVTFVPLLDGKGRVQRILGLINDITGRKKVEEALSLREEQLQIIMENTTAHLAYFDRNFNFIKVNSAYAKGSGYPTEELLGKNHFFFFPHKENQYLFEKARGTGHRIEFKAKPFVFKNHPERGVTYWDWTLTPIKDSNGRTQSLVLSLVDVTDIKRTEEDLRKSQERFERIFAESPIGIVRFDEQGHLVDANKTCFELFGVSDMSKVKGYDLFSDPYLHEESKRLLKQGQKITYEAEYDFDKVKELGFFETDKKGRISLDISITPLHEKKTTRIFGYLVQIHDITERKELEKRKDEFISMASHELKTPLTSIKAFTQILQRHWANLDDPKSIHLLSRMNVQVNKLTDLINELLDVTKIQAGKLQIKTGLFSLNKLVKEVTEDVQATIQSNHQIVIKGGALLRARIDRYRLAQALTNLLNNAVKYSPGAQKVIVKISRQENQARVDIQDFGIGIPKHEQEYVFTRFYQINNIPDNTRGFAGLGLGLYITAEIIKNHGGKIWVKSKPSKGSTFSFTLPSI